MPISTWRSCHGLDVSDGVHPLVSLGHLALSSGRIAAGRYLRMIRPLIRDHGLAHDRLSGIESRIFRKIMQKRAPAARADSVLSDEYCAFRAAPCNAPRPCS